MIRRNHNASDREDASAWNDGDEQIRPERFVRVAGSPRRRWEIDAGPASLALQMPRRRMVSEQGRAGSDERIERVSDQARPVVGYAMDGVSERVPKPAYGRIAP